LIGARTKELDWIRRCNIVLVALLSFFSLYFGRLEVTLSVMLGGLISIFNFRAFVRMCGALLQGEPAQSSLAAKILIKFVVLMAVVALGLLWLPTDPIAFVVGISVTPLSICLIGMAQALKGPSERPESTDA